MSQPPQQGGPGEPEGFGAPFEPQPGVYGAPVPPRSQPQPDPYGQPSQPPYGYPQPPTVPYGHPGSPPSSPPDGPGGGRSRGRVAALVAAVLAGVLVIGTGVWFTVGGDADDGKPVAKESGASKKPGPEVTPAEGADELNKGRKDGEAKVRWVEKNGVDLPQGGARVYGPWVTGDIVAKAMYRTASGHSAEDGTRKWSLRLPADVCAAPTLPSPDGKVVIALRADTSDGAPCDRLQMIDLTTGKAGWTATVERTGMQDGLSHIVMAINGDVVTVGRTTLTDAYRISDGKHLWGTLPGTCQPYGLTSGDIALAAVDCRKRPSDDDVGDEEVRRIDPATGRTVWTYKVKKGWKVDRFYSVDPPVVSLRQGELNEKWAIALLNPDGTYRAQPVPGKESFEVRCGEPGENLDDCIGAAADSDTLYLATKPAAGADGELTNSVVAFDLSTGKAQWKVPAPPAQTLHPMRVENGQVLLYLTPPPVKAGNGGGIMALGPQGGALRPVLRHPASAATAVTGLFEPTVRFVGGRSLIASGYITAETDEEETDLRTMIAFGD
ncbi:PQQ-like beta-propeller repeat protein [Streptomyces anulatus]|uniref:outer membrane protein assembly factor BamB family protein n=1 Tax=Streptomyces anulatus TaxID=1892 RepID=UPI00224D3A39|nr:PQQ-binding-like beta-propeller repeat protein [Streptomyces anulatus]MCX4518865.1 PQQ-like beta-propeller repeat protein [Streptomyces anulatus]MCX4601746.1 PQQ-like beta-propeller repeat protein [Streptomyces anulatus]